MDFVLFLLVNATLFIRPSEFVPDLEGWQIYNYLIITNLLVAAPKVLAQLQGNSLAKSPATVCVLGVLSFIFISHLARFDFWSARYGAFEFLKVVAYYLLLISVLDTPKRLFTFLGAIAAFTMIVVTLSVLHYHQIVDIPVLSAVADKDIDELTGEVFTVMRMRATGIFNDPNDLSMIIVVAMGVCGFGLFCPSAGGARFALTLPVGFFAYALALTHSRGGLLALVCGLVVVLHARFGWQRAGLAAAMAIPVVLLGFGGRQADIGGAISGGTGRDRAELWSQGLQGFKASPLFGIGYDLYADYAGQVAHNAFVHTFVELGFFGGACFLGVFFVVALSLWRAKAIEAEMPSAALAQLRPYLLGIVAAVCVSMLSLSRCYIVPTYMIAGLGVAYDRLARGGTSLPPLECNTWLISRLSAASLLFIPGVYLYIKVFARMM